MLYIKVELKLLRVLIKQLGVFIVRSEALVLALRCRISPSAVVGFVMKARLVIVLCGNLDFRLAAKR